LGNIPQALNFHSKALAVRIKMGDKARMGDSDNNLANICIRQGDPDLAIKYYIQSIAVQEEIENATVQEFAAVHSNK
jgi:tetratricopeptide (TPR) repeat protein